MPRRIRIGAVSYLNTLPLVHGLRRGPGAESVELSFATPAALAENMSDGSLDVALMPVAAYPEMPELEIVPGLAIGTFGPCRSVLLFTRGPAEEVERVALDPESRTSNALVRVLFDGVWKRRPDFRMGSGDVTRDLRTCDAVVRIGDKALFGDPACDGLHCHDLGQVWTEATGRPFVFAAWFARPGVVDRPLYELLHRSRREGSRAIEALAADYVWNGMRDAALCRDYLERNIRYRLGSAEVDALQSFFRAACACGAIEREPRVRMALRRHTACDEIAEREGLASRGAK